MTRLLAIALELREWHMPPMLLGFNGSGIMGYVRDRKKLVASNDKRYDT